MDASKGKGKKGNLIVKTWERCRSIGHGRKSSPAAMPRGLVKKSKSWPRSGGGGPLEEDKRTKKRQVAPEGCFSVYVGPQRQRFVIKTEYANHPLFKTLLEEAESEFGYTSDGPLVLPCNVDVFYEVLLAMDDGGRIRQGCGLAKSYSSYRLLRSPRLVAINQFQL